LDLQQEYELLIQGNVKCSALFDIKFDRQTFTTKLQPKNKKCQKIVNSLLNEKYLKNYKQEFQSQEITLSNISQFKSKSFIGSSTIETLSSKTKKRNSMNNSTKDLETRKTK